MAHVTDKQRDIFQTIRNNLMIQIDCPPVTCAMVWRSPTQRTMVIRFGVMVNGTFKELCAAYFDGDEVPDDIHDGAAWDLDKLKGWVSELGYKRIDLRNAPRDEQGRITKEQGGVYVPSHDGTKYIPSRELPTYQIDIKREIYIFVAESGGWVSRCEIAKAVKRTKSTWLNGQIEQLVNDGYLTRTQVLRSNGMTMFFYMVNL